MKRRNQGKTRTQSSRKARAKARPKRTIEQKYQQVFTPRPLPFQGLYTDDDSLEQPSELQYVPATSSPTVEG
jgi:hypothetical protein